MLRLTRRVSYIISCKELCYNFDEISWPCRMDSDCVQRGKSQDIKGRMRIIFEDAYGMQEAGIDGGGLFKDFMENLVKQAFDPFFGLFLSTSDNRMYPNPNAHLAVGQATQAFEYIGKMVGKALYEVSCPLTTVSTFVARSLYLKTSEKKSKSLFQRWLWVGVLSEKCNCIFWNFDLWSSWPHIPQLNVTSLAGSIIQFCCKECPLSQSQSDPAIEKVLIFNYQYAERCNWASQDIVGFPVILGQD